MPKIRASRYSQGSDKIDYLARLYALLEDDHVWTHGKVQGIKIWRESGDLFTLRIAVDLFGKDGIPAFHHLYFHGFRSVMVLARKAA
jgi:hypothetical protein